MLNLLKEYLVSLGFKVDSSSLDQAKRAISSLEGAIDNFSDSSTKNFAIAAAGVSTFFATASVGIAKFIGEIAEADMDTELFARRMWMSVDAAKAYQSSLDALGVELQDLYLSPELMQRFQELRQDAFSMQLSDDAYRPTMKYIRDIIFEFKRLKLEATYSFQWIAYYFMKYMDPIFGDASHSLKSINDLIQKNMPIWTQKIAMVLSWFVRLATAAWSAREGIAAIVAIFAAFKLFNLGPLGMAIMAITALLLLIDDYNTYEKGGESVFSNLWKDIDKFKDLIDEDFDDSVENAWKIFIEILKTVGEIFRTLDDIVEEITGKDSLTLALEALHLTLEGVKGLFEGILEVVKQIEGSVKVIDGIVTGDEGKKEEGKKELKDSFSGMFELRPFWKDLFNGIKNSPFTKPGLIPGFGGFAQTAFPTHVYRNNSNVKNNSDNSTTISNTYNVYGGSDANGIAKTIDFHQKQTLTRFNQGVLV